MVNATANIIRQAQQGSVAAIIQILNDKLVDDGIRTRAMLDGGILQLLCEAETVDSLEQAPLVERLRQILEGIEPRNISRVKINSRIVREQQLLWLDEIKRDPENQLLWAEEIVLRRPNLFQQLARDLQQRKTDDVFYTSFRAETPHRKREKTLLWRGLIGGASLSLLMVLVGGAVWTLVGQQYLSFGSGDRPSPSAANSPPSPSLSSPAVATPLGTASPSPQPNPNESPDRSLQSSKDAFDQAVRIASQADADGKTATTPRQWLELAARWQQASDLMASVSPDYERYDVAQDRMVLYRQFSETASGKAQELRR